jgi:hypothetical protein
MYNRGNTIHRHQYPPRPHTPSEQRFVRHIDERRNWPDFSHFPFPIWKVRRLWYRWKQYLCNQSRHNTSHLEAVKQTNKLTSTEIPRLLTGILIPSQTRWKKIIFDLFSVLLCVFLGVVKVNMESNDLHLLNKSAGLNRCKVTGRVLFQFSNQHLVDAITNASWEMKPKHFCLH